MSTEVAAPELPPPALGADLAHVEKRGIEYVPLSARKGRPLDLAWLWSATILNPGYVVYGALVMSLGLTWAQAAVVIVLGNLTWFLTGLTSLQGPAAGTTAFGVSRAAFGHNGNRLVALCNWMQAVGYEAFNLTLIVYAILALLSKAGVHQGTDLKIVVIVGVAALQGILPFLGYDAIMKTLTKLVIPFIVLYVILAILTVPKTDLSTGHPVNLATLLVALAICAAPAGFGWTMNASDYSRYLPPNANKQKIVWSVTLGGLIPSTLLMLLGAAITTVISGATDPISGLPHAFAAWFVVPYLLFVIVQLYAGVAIDLYSSGVTLQALGLNVKRWVAVIIDCVLAGGLVAAVVFSAKFYTYFGDFLLFMIVWFAPWTAIYLVDYFLRRGRYDSRALMDANAGIYVRRGAVHLPGLVAQVVGMVASLLWINTSIFKGPLSSATDGSDLSIFMGFLIGGAIYYLWARRTVSQEAEATPSTEEVDRELVAAYGEQT